MAAIVWGLCTERYWDRWRLAMITFIYCSKEVYILTKQMHAVLRPCQNLGLVLPGWIILHCHITLTSLLPSLSNGFMLWKPQTRFILVTTNQSPHTKTAILSIMMSLWLRLINNASCVYSNKFTWK